MKTRNPKFTLLVLMVGLLCVPALAGLVYSAAQAPAVAQQSTARLLILIGTP